MPIINGVKYACEPCMRGHRSSKCTHEDRLLVQVRKPGRPLSSCPHLPTGAVGTATFVDANGVRLDDATPPHGHGTGGKPCGCEVTSLAIPKVAACACSIPQYSSSTTASTSKISPFEIRIYPHQPFKTRVSSPPTSPISPASVYSATSESSTGRISKNTKKRKSISVSGEAILEIASREALFKVTGQQCSPENGTVAERIAEPSAEVGYGGDNIHLTSTQLSNRHTCMPPGQQSEASQFQSRAAGSAHDLPSAINNSVFWAQDNWRSEFGVSVSQRPSAQPVALQQPTPCCNGCGSKPAKVVPAVAHNHQLVNQTQFQPPLPFGPSQGPPFHPMFHESMQHMQPIATTIYTYPNGYTTVNNPLTPQELRMLQATGAWSFGAAAAWSGLGVGTTGNGIDAEHACLCGPGCECLGCAAHPFNTSTVNFVKDMRTIMYSDRHGVPPRRQQVVEDHPAAIHGVVPQTNRCCGGGAQQRNNMVVTNNVSHSHPELISPSTSIIYGAVHSQQGFEHTSSPHPLISHPPRQHVSSSPHPQQIQDIVSSQSHDVSISNSPLSQPSPSPLNNHSPTPLHSARPHHCRPSAPINVSSPSYTSVSSPDATYDGDDTETEQNTVSPSAYFHIDYPLGLCTESGMGCLCGDDCTCIGCMIHGNNMPDMGTTHNEPIDSEPPTTRNLNSRSHSTRSGGCCGSGGGINFNSENGIEEGSSRDLKDRGPSNITNNNPRHQLSSGHVSSNIHQRPQVHPLHQESQSREIGDGQSVYVWA